MFEISEKCEEVLKIICNLMILHEFVKFSWFFKNICEFIKCFRFWNMFMNLKLFINLGKCVKNIYDVKNGKL